MIRSWFADHQRCREPYYSFCAAVEQAAAEWAIEVASRIAKAGQNGDWKADAWQLERRCRDEYAAPSKVEVSGPDGGAVLLGRVQLTQEEATARLRMELAADPSLRALIAGEGGVDGAGGVDGDDE